jgi:two-component system, NtrC family, sensor kinase
MVETARIIIVDDEEHVLSSLKRLFRPYGYETVTFSSAKDALKHIKESKPFHVVISDYRMPEMNGVDFLKEVRKCSPRTVRIVLSGYADAGSIIEATNEGQVYKFIPKPWNDEELRISIQNCLEHFSLEKRNSELLEELALSNQVLEEKVQRRTEQLELHNQALRFSQNLLGCLPVGVVVVDANNMISFCNESAATLLENVFSNLLGSYVSECRDASLGRLVEQVRCEKNILGINTTLGGTAFRLNGRTFESCESESVLLVFMDEETQDPFFS